MEVLTRNKVTTGVIITLFCCLLGVAADIYFSLEVYKAKTQIGTVDPSTDFVQLEDSLDALLLYYDEREQEVSKLTTDTLNRTKEIVKLREVLEEQKALLEKKGEELTLVRITSASKGG
ncbi:MAG: hypothetical protein KA479_09610 [Saprospiraceae bacterium]|nr:hypothetical protein [Saprospiraceae bacterium]